MRGLKKTTSPIFRFADDLFCDRYAVTERSPNIRDHKPEADRSRSDFENWQKNREQKKRDENVSTAD
jgi:hypothetical protein